MFLTKKLFMSVAEAFGDIAEVIAKIAPAKIVELRPSASMQRRVNDLIQKKKNAEISVDEAVELERYLSLYLFITLAKARARLILNQ